MRAAVFVLCIFSSHVLRLVASSNDYRPPHRCPDLDLISVGRVTPHQDDVDYTSPVIGDVATYSCVQGFRVVGDVTRTCILILNGTAVWNGTEPYCEILNCGDPGVPLHGKRYGKEFTYGEKVWYSCHNDTTLVGATTISCNEHGEWSNPRPFCRKYGSEGFCSLVRSIENGRMVVGGRRVGEKIWFICYYGYTMMGPRSIRCQLNATWSDRPPVCVSVCTDPPAITNGSADATYAAINRTITYSCDACYEMEENVEVKCLPNKIWSQPLPHCKRITCDNPMDTVLGKRNHQFFCGAEMIFECAEGYQIVGSNRLTCLENGNWSNHMPICEYAPEIGNCPELVPPINGSIAYSINDSHVTAEYSCHAGYSLIGNVMRFCNDSGVWDGTASRCVDEDTSKCQLLDAPTNGFVVIGGFQHGDNATYFCNTDYILMSGDHVRQCMTNGQWSGNAASCQRIEPLCLKPDNILNASYTVAMPISTTINSGQLHHNVIVMGRVIRNATNVSGTDETALMFLLGSVAHYSCDEGYVMTGSNTLMCFINGSWIGDIGSCETLKCPQPREHENSYVIPGGDLSIGSAATYHCYHGFFPDVNSSMTVTCQDNGTWTELDARCSPAVCEYPAVKDDVIVSGREFTYASKGVRLKCASSQARQTRRNARSKCLSDSTWSVQNFTCSGGVCPVDINFELCNSTDFAFIGTVQEVKKSNLLVTVERTLYQSLPIQKEQLKILLSNPSLPNTQTCCKRMTTNSTYIFAGNYNINNRRVGFISNGCRTIYKLSLANQALFDIQNVEHSFLEQCRFRILAFSN